MAHYVFTATSERVPPDTKVFEIPPGISAAMPQGGWVTADNRRVTLLKDESDGIGIAPLQDPTKFSRVDLAPDLRDQLARIEAKIDRLLAK